MSDERKGISWEGVITLILILIIASVAAFVLSSIESFIAGVAAVFIGLILGFFRDDLRRVLGLSREKEEPVPVDVEIDKTLLKLEKKIAKERKSLAKLISKVEVEYSFKKQQKLNQYIIEEATGLIALIDQAKSVAIRMKDTDLVRHYDALIDEIETERMKASTRLSESV